MFKKSILVLSIVSLVLIGSSVSGSGRRRCPRSSDDSFWASALFADKNLSENKNQSCMSCHHPSAEFADPDNAADPKNNPVSDGSFPEGFWRSQRAHCCVRRHSARSCIGTGDELYIGGMFWDGRASGLVTSATAGIGAGPTFDPLADQAKGPFLNPVEMAMAR